MQLLLDVQDNKAAFMMDLLKNFKFVKVKPTAKTAKEIFLEELKEAVEQVNLAKEGKIKLKTAQQLLNEL